MQRIGVGDKRPTVAGSAWVAPGAVLAGDVIISEGASVWYASVLRADGDTIRIGAGSNIQDGCVLHADPGLPVNVGNRVTVGHRAILHGCTVDDEALIGMGAIVLNGAHVGAGCLVAAGAVVREGARIPPNSLVAGIPAVVRRDVTAAERRRMRSGNDVYHRLAAAHAAAVDETSARRR
jgi:carbonic anhydrase/acetyltransferase-like protein (isoleucine patch superfamily)